MRMATTATIRRLAAATMVVAATVSAPASADGLENAVTLSDGSSAPIHRVFTYRQDDGVPVFTDRVPRNQVYEVMEYACYACNPRSSVDWYATTLHADKFAEVIHAAADQHGVDAALVRAVIHAESNFNPEARSRKGAMGLMQLMPGTARDLGVTDPIAVHQNVDGGVRYLADLLEQYQGDVTLATAAYNAGPGNVARYGGVPPFEETQTYVKRVKILHDRYKGLDQS